jgi:poly(3-hydroxybutyrate) depolymerase
MGNEQSAAGVGGARSRGGDGGEPEVVSLGERKYLRVPPANSPTAMVVCLHGHGGSGAQLRKSVGEQFEGVQSLLVVYPDGIGHAWNDGRKGEQGDGAPDDVAFLTTLITTERQRSPTITRVCCTGMSNGAMMTFRMLRDRADVVDCFAPVCGLLPRWPVAGEPGVDAVSLPRASAAAAVSDAAAAAAGVRGLKTKVVLIVGELDKLVPVCGGAVGRIMRSEQSLRGDGLKAWESKREEKMAERRGEVHSLDATREALEHMLGVAVGAPHRLESEQKYTGEERRSADGRLRILTVKEGGHQWPGSKGASTWLPFTGTVPTFSAGAEILKTFLTDE